ncbi:MAG: UDP-glucose 4-epimerase GalE [Akkermansiaceae bacterium]
MKIAVTGGAGYIGSVCVELLCESGHEVVVIDNLSEGHRAAVDSRAHLEVADLAETGRLTGILRDHATEAVIHYAAYALVGESMSDPGKYYRNNVGGGLSLLEAMVAAQVPKIVFSSTCATYGIPESVPIDESAPQRPVNPYGHSKLTFEGMLHWFGEAHGLSSVMFRYFNAAGASRQFGEHHRIETHLIPNVLFAAQGRRKEIEIYGTDYDTPDGTAVRDYVHVSDLAEIHKQAVEEDVTGAFNLGTGQGHSVREVIEACAKATGREIPVRDCPRRPGDPPVLVAATGKAVREWGWAPRFSDLEKTVRSAWEWHEAHPEGYAD